MEAGVTLSSRSEVNPRPFKISIPHGTNLPDPFFDNYEEESLTCRDILEDAGMQSQGIVTITIDRKFLKKIIHSHIIFIKSLES